MSELKPGWRRVRFGEVVRLVSDRCDPLSSRIERFVGLEHIEPGDLRVRSWGDVGSGTTFTNRFRPGQVLFGKRRAYQRKVAVADFDGVCSGDIYVMESANSGRLLGELLPFICQTNAFFEHAVGTSAGSLSPRTNWTSLAGFEFALPPPEEQRRFVSLLRSLHEARYAALLTKEVAEVARRAMLFDWFRPRRGGRDHFPPHWKIIAVGDAGETQVGIRKHPGSLSGPSMLPYLRVANVLDGHIDWSDILKINVPEADLERCALRSGDILVNKGNSMNLVGRSAIFNPAETSVCYFQDHLLRFRVRDEVVAEFAHAYLQHLFYTLQFTRIAVASTSIATIPSESFERLPFPVPPRKEQEQMVAQIAANLRAQSGLRERESLAAAMTTVSLERSLRAAIA